MLRSLNIRSKLLLTVLVPLLALISVAAIVFPTFQTVKVGGPEYKKIAELQDLRADVLPPPALILEAHNVVGTLLTDLDTSLMNSRHDRLTALEKQFNERHKYWQERLEGKNERLYLPLQKSYALGQQYFKLVNTQFLPVLDSSFKKGFQISKLGVDNNQPGTAEYYQSFTLFSTRLTKIYEQHRGLIDEVVGKLDVDVPARLDSINSVVRGRISLLAFAAFAAMILSALLGFAVSRSIANPVDQLTKAARNAAEEELPRIVAEVQNLPADADIPVAKKVVVDSKDELGDLAAALNSMQGTAVSLAAEQARIRRNFSENLVNLGRRNQALLGRTLNLITQLEQNERDSDKLEELFRLDHLTTRMRRNAESLLVLAGADQARMWSPPVDVGDVVRGALSEIEAYDRVDIQSIDAAEIQGNSVNDVSHLLAELIENATTFSPPSTRVTVLGKQRGDGYLFVILDDGVGMTPEDFELANRRISEVSSFDTTPSRVLGLSVVGRLCKRHGIQVKLTENVTNGVAARILIPLSMLGGQRDEVTMPSTDLPTRPGTPTAEPQHTFPLPEYSFDDEPITGVAAPTVLSSELDEHFGVPVSYNSGYNSTFEESFPSGFDDAPSYDAPSYDAPSYDGYGFTAPAETTEHTNAEVVDLEDHSFVTASVDNTQFDTTAYDNTGYDTTSYDTTAYDNNGYDTTNLDHDAPFETTPFETTPFETPAFETPTFETPEFGDSQLDTTTHDAAPYDEVHNGHDVFAVSAQGWGGAAAPALTPVSEAAQPDAPTPIAEPAIPVLSKRVRGAQMVDTGPEATEEEPSDRTPDIVRSALSSLQTGMLQGRQSETLPSFASPVDTDAPTMLAAEPPATPPSLTASPTFAQPALASVSATAGLSRRVKGAQMIDTGPAVEEEAPPARNAHDVRSMLASLQSGVQSAKTEIGEEVH